VGHSSEDLKAQLSRERVTMLTIVGETCGRRRPGGLDRPGMGASGMSGRSSPPLRMLPRSMCCGKTPPGAPGPGTSSLEPCIWCQEVHRSRVGTPD
jgi:hypothetical protein